MVGEDFADCYRLFCSLPELVFFDVTSKLYYDVRWSWVVCFFYSGKCSKASEILLGEEHLFQL